MSSKPEHDLGVWLAPGEYVDSGHPRVVETARAVTAAAQSPADRAQAIFNYAREIAYRAAPFEDLESYRASQVIAASFGYCVAKASAFVALCRAAGLAARPAFADVTNHLSTPKQSELMGSEVYAWHGYAEVWLDGRWVKVSPTFNSSLCAKLGVAPLEFDGRSDAILQAFDAAGRTFMSYDRLHGHFHDIPARFLSVEMPRRYPQACAAIRAGAV